MDINLAVELGQQALFKVLLLSAPLLGLCLLVGIIISIFQAVTQIQEQTLAFAPKIIAVFAALLLFGPWMINLLVDYTQSIFALIPQMAK